MKTNYQSEEEFLKNYDVKEFKQLSMTTDILIISVSEEENSNYRKTSKKKMSILLVKRDDYPYKGKWCLPGGFINVDTETLEECAKRILKTETNLTNIYLEQLYTFDSINRDPRCRVISCSYMALVDKNKLKDQINDNTCWFDVVKIMENDNTSTLILNNGIEEINFIVKKQLRELSNNQYNYEIIDNKSLAFDHALVILTGIERLKNKINYTDIVFNMIPKYFTLGELQQVYEIILGKKLLDPAFRRIIKDKVIKTNKIKTGEGHRPSVLFTYNSKL